MLIRGTEPGTFFRLIWHNTLPELTRKPSSTFRGGGMLLASFSAYCWGMFFGLSLREYPFAWAGATLFLFLLDLMVGTARTLGWLRQLDSIGGKHRDNGSKTSTQEGE